MATAAASPGCWRRSRRWRSVATDLTEPGEARLVKIGIEEPEIAAGMEPDDQEPDDERDQGMPDPL